MGVDNITYKKVKGQQENRWFVIKYRDGWDMLDYKYFTTAREADRFKYQLKKGVTKWI